MERENSYAYSEDDGWGEGADETSSPQLEKQSSVQSNSAGGAGSVPEEKEQVDKVIITTINVYF